MKKENLHWTTRNGDENQTLVAGWKIARKFLESSIEITGNKFGLKSERP